MKRISTQLYNSCDVSVSDFLNDKQNKVHMQLYNDALSKCIAELGIDKDAYAFYEVEGNQDFFEPVSVIIISRNYPFTRQKVDLTKWWSSYKFLEKREPFDFVEDEEFDIKYYDVVYKDYIRGKYNLESKFYDDKIMRDFNAVGINRKSDEMSLNSSFQYRVKNEIYG